MSRRSYRGLMSWPAWGLYVDGKLLATIRAKNIGEAEDLFEAHGYTGVVLRLPSDGA